MEYQNYRDILKTYFDGKKKQNPSYTLNAFSQEAGLRKGEMSDIFNRRYGLSLEKAKRVLENLSINNIETEQLFLVMVESEHARSRTQRQLARKKLAQLQPKEPSFHYTEQVFETISNWYHLAICELAQKNNFKDDPQWVADQLNISEDEARNALVRLYRLEILQKDENKTLTADFAAISSDVPSPAIRKFHKQILTKAADAIDNQEISNRDLSTLHFLVNKKDLPALKVRLKAFRRELLKEFESIDQEAVVYCHSSQLFQLSKDVES